MNNKYTNLLFIFTFLTIKLSFAAESQKSPVNTRWETLNSLIKAEEKTIKGLGWLGPKLQYRLLELKSEKIKLLIERENDFFLSDKSKKHKKSWYFRKSKKLFREVNKMGHRIIKKYPKFSKIARIYYTLALNERDYGGDKRTEKYLFLALSTAKKKDRIIHNTKTSLAEYYYNNKKYKLAVKYYNDVVKNKKDEWYTRHLFNHAWCLLKEDKMNLAIDNMRKSFKGSDNPRYISMKKQILESFVIFFVHGSKINEGIEFYMDNVIDPTSYFISMAKKTANKGLFKETTQVIKAALSKAKQFNKNNKLVDIRLTELEIYRNFKKFNLYFETAKHLRKLHENEKFTLEAKDEAVRKISSLVGYLQVRLSKNLKMNNKDYDKKELNRIISYFKILSAIDKHNKDLYSYYIGETFYSVSRYSDAAEFYQQGITASLSKKNLKGKESKSLQKIHRKYSSHFLLY